MPFGKLSLDIADQLTIKEGPKLVFDTETSSVMVTSDLPTLNNQPILSIFGDWFDNDTRTIMSLLKIGDIPYNLTLVDCLQR